MPPLTKIFLFLGCINALLAVLLGAFAAHALKTRLPTELLTSFHTGNQYHFYHALGLLLIGLIAVHLPASALLKWSGWVMFAGIILFSGSLYILSLTGMRGFGAITPFGGMAFMVSWFLCAVAVWRG